MTGSIFSRALTGLYIVSFASGFSMGMFNPLISILMEESGSDPILIAANSSLYYLVITLMAPLVAKVIRVCKLKITILTGIVLTTLSTALFPYTDNVYGWFILRTVMAIGVSLYMIAGQTGLNIYANAEKRGLIVALHGTAFGIGFMLSPVIGTWAYAHYPVQVFTYSSAIIFCSIFAVLFFLPKNVTSYRYAFSLTTFKKLSIPLHGVFIYGMLEGFLMTLLPILMVRQAIDISLVGLPLTLFMVASGIGMIPVSYFGDKVGRSRLLLISSVVGIITLSVTIGSHHPHTYIAAAILLGLSVGTFFPVTLAMVGEKISQSEMHTGSCLFTAFFSTGCAVGPISAALLIALLGNNHMFSLIIILLLMLAFRLIPKRFFTLRPTAVDQKG